MRHIQDVLTWVHSRFPGEPEFHQAAGEVFHSLELELARNPVWEKEKVLYRLAVPERDISFRIVWEDDQGNIQINRGYRVQFSTLLGPYKGGLRFHPTVNQSILHFLGFEQCFKNALTGLNLGGGKGGSDFNPHGRSDREIMRFCQAFMTELQRHIGANTDVPAGDIGVGGREIGYMHGQYRRIRNSWEGELTGKGAGWGGSLFRPEATGYGLVFFVEHMLAAQHDSLHGKRVALSGSGNVATFAAEALHARGSKVLSFSDSCGAITCTDGFSAEQIREVAIRKGRGERLEFMASALKAEYLASGKPWHLKADIALPCATQNEIDATDAQLLAHNGCKLVAEGANMPSTQEAIGIYRKNGIAYGPGKAANAGGVACSGLEMSQNAVFRPWTRDFASQQLAGIMADIYTQCATVADELGRPGDFELGANVAGFRRLGNAMLAQGLV